MQSVIIQPVREDDFETWLLLWKEYQRFYDINIPETVTLQTWARLLDPAEPMHALLAWHGDQVLGFAHSVYHRSTWTSADNCYLQDLFVANAARGHGIGRALIEHVYAQAKQNAAARVHWLTHETNHTGRQLYDRVAQRSGFIQYRKALT